MEKLEAIRKILTPEEEEKANKEARSLIMADQELAAIFAKCEHTDVSIERSYPSLIRFINDHKTCIGCKGYKYCPKKGTKGLQLMISYNIYTDTFDDSFVPCHYYQAIKEVFSYFIFSDISLWSGYDSSTKVINAFRKNKETSVVPNTFIAVANQLFADTRKFTESASNLGAIITSDNTNGAKLLEALAFQYARQKKTVAFIDARKTLNDCSSLNENIRKEGTEDLTKALTAQALFIIGLGFEYKSAAARDTVLIPLLTDRAQKGKITYVTTYLSFEDLLSAYSKGEASMNMLKKIIEKTMEPKQIIDVELFTD